MNVTDTRTDRQTEHSIARQKIVIVYQYYEELCHVICSSYVLVYTFTVVFLFYFERYEFISHKASSG